MSDSIFQNGNKRIFKLTMWKLGIGIVVITLLQFLPQIHNMDFVSERTRHILVFIISTMLTINKSIEMFFDQTIQLFKSGDLHSGETQFLLRPEGDQQKKGQ